VTFFQAIILLAGKNAKSVDIIMGRKSAVIVDAKVTEKVSK
jgi:hypothetical protein